MALYDILSGEDLRIAELIQRRRLQMLVHSYIYYEIDSNIWSDFMWSSKAAELVKLQKSYPDIASKVIYADAFENWDGSTGAFLPYNLPNIVAVAERLCSKSIKENTKPSKHIQSKKRRLF